MAADVIFLRAATNAAAAWRVALDFPTAGLPTEGLPAAALPGAAAGFAGAVALVVFESAGVVAATFFLVGIWAFRSVGRAAVTAACLVEFGEDLSRAEDLPRAVVGAAVGLDAGLAAAAVVVRGLAALARAEATAGFDPRAAGCAVPVRLSEAGCIAVRAAALDGAAGLALGDGFAVCDGLTRCDGLAARPFALVATGALAVADLVATALPATGFADDLPAETFLVAEDSAADGFGVATMVFAVRSSALPVRAAFGFGDMIRHSWVGEKPVTGISGCTITCPADPAGLRHVGKVESPDRRSAFPYEDDLVWERNAAQVVRH